MSQTIQDQATLLSQVLLHDRLDVETALTNVANRLEADQEVRAAVDRIPDAYRSWLSYLEHAMRARADPDEARQVALTGLRHLHDELFGHQVGHGSDSEDTDEHSDRSRSGNDAENDDDEDD